MKYQVILGNQLDWHAAVRALAVLSSCWLAYLLVSAIYNVWLHPLRKYPGAFLDRASNIPFALRNLRGIEVEHISKLHQKYGYVVRVAPNELSYASTEAWGDIYGPKSKLAGRKWTGLYDPRNPQIQTMQGANDSEHPRLRRIFSPAFSEKALREQQPMLKGYTNKMVQRLHGCIKEQPDTPIDFTQMFMYVTFDIMGDFAFGEKLGMIDRMEYLPWVAMQFGNLKISALFTTASYVPIFKPLVSLFRLVFRGMVNASLDFAAEHVNRRLEVQPDKRDLWSYVLSEKSSEALSLRDMHNHGLLFMLAGTETSATALAGVTFLLAKNPDKLQKLTAEIRAFKSPEELTLQKLAQLPYLNACVEEGLRVYPPVRMGLPRVTPPGGAVISGQWVAPDTVVYVSQEAAYKLSANFKNADEFIPERWISPGYSSDKKSVLQPFLVGPRNCLGQGLAYHEIRLILATFVYHFDFELVEEEGKDWINQKVFFLNEKPPLMFKLKSVYPADA